MASYGGESPTGTFIVNIASSGLTDYTVPTGKYVRASILARDTSITNSTIAIDGDVVYTFGSSPDTQTANITNVIIPSGTLIRITSNFSAMTGVITGAIYNNPS